MVFVRDYETAITSGVPLSNLTLEITLRHPNESIGESVYVAYEHGHVGVVTVRSFTTLHHTGAHKFQ